LHAPITRTFASYTLSDDPARPDLAAMHSYLHGAYWSQDCPCEVLERAVQELTCASWRSRGATGEAQVGFGAFHFPISATFCYVCDVYVPRGAPRPRGVARAMLALACFCRPPAPAGTAGAGASITSRRARAVPRVRIRPARAARKAHGTRAPSTSHKGALEAGGPPARLAPPQPLQQVLRHSGDEATARPILPTPARPATECCRLRAAQCGRGERGVLAQNAQAAPP
jgi:hypothetical protein